MPGRNRHDEPWPIDMAENMGSPTRTAAWKQNCDGRPRTPHRGYPSSDLGRWHNLPVRCGTEPCLTGRYPTRCLPDCRLSRSRRDVVPMMPWSGLSLTQAKHAYEMGTSELHRTSIMLAAAALTTNRSMYPKDLSRKPRQKPGRAPKNQRNRYGGSIVLRKTA